MNHSITPESNFKIFSHTALILVSVGIHYILISYNIRELSACEAFYTNMRRILISFILYIVYLFTKSTSYNYSFSELVLKINACKYYFLQMNILSIIQKIYNSSNYQTKYLF